MDVLNYIMHVNNFKALTPQMFSTGRHQFNIPFANRGKHVSTSAGTLQSLTEVTP